MCLFYLLRLHQRFTNMSFMTSKTKVLSLAISWIDKVILLKHPVVSWTELCTCSWIFLALTVINCTWRLRSLSAVQNITHTKSQKSLIQHLDENQTCSCCGQRVRPRSRLWRLSWRTASVYWTKIFHMSAQREEISSVCIIDSPPLARAARELNLHRQRKFNNNEKKKVCVDAFRLFTAILSGSRAGWE